MLNQKGISPLVATVLLISLVVAIAGIISQWSNIFAREQTDLVTEQSRTSISCSYGNINMRDLRFQSAESRLSGAVENVGQIELGNITLSIIYQNATSQVVQLCDSPSGSVSCSVSNLTLSVAERVGFNVSIWGSNYDSIKIVTNCTAVSDSASRGDVA